MSNHVPYSIHWIKRWGAEECWDGLHTYLGSIWPRTDKPGWRAGRPGGNSFPYFDTKQEAMDYVVPIEAVIERALP